MIKAILPLISIVRLGNVVMTGCAVILGIWLTQSGISTFTAFFLMTAAMAATAYGNVINDILDIKSDLISHPERPLANGSMSVRTAAVFAAALVIASLLSALWASTFHLKAAFLPLILLTLYSIYFKRTRLMGNFIVALLVAYALLFGSLPLPQTKILFLPAMLAFLLNFCREIAKDIQDTEGDRNAGITTSAALPDTALKAILLSTAAAYASIAFLPSLLLKHFGIVYTIVCLLAVIPLHVLWITEVLKADLKNRAKRIAMILKLEMIAGLLAMALDKILKINL
ncbi:MAG: UbiA family prenyltransferase [Chitinispirillales bacterium]|nr:UbiA family prenyltransferase [Chitinispirillales bacterium]